jgi:hypothetical protein
MLCCQTKRAGKAHDHAAATPWRFTNHAIIAFGLLLCVALAVVGAYLLGLLELVGLLQSTYK